MTYPGDMDTALIDAFAQYWDSPNGEWTSPTIQEMKHLSKRWNDALTKRFADCKNDFHILRMSAIGKPLIETLFCAFHWEIYTTNRELETVRAHQRMSEGDEFEIDLAIHLIRMGFTIKNFYNDQHELRHREVTGHVDYIVSHPDITGGDDILLECKAIASHTWKKYTEHGPDDTYGYKTQLGLYSKLTGLPAYWVLYNKETSEISVVPYGRYYTDEDRDAALARLDYLIDVWEELHPHFSPDNWHMAFNFARPPEPEAEVFEYLPTNKFLIPPNMRYCNSKPYVYKILPGTNGYGKPQNYVVDYSYPKEVEHLKPELPYVIPSQEELDNAERKRKAKTRRQQQRKG